MFLMTAGLSACGGDAKKDDKKVTKKDDDDKADAKKDDAKKDAKADEKGDEKKPDDKAAAGGPPNFAVFVTHKVKDYDAWKKVFDEDEQARKDGSLVMHTVNQSVDDPNLVHIYGLIADPAKFEEMMKSDEMKKKMADAGVEGEPEVWAFNGADTDMTPEMAAENNPGVVLKHKVKDFDVWKKAFDEGAQDRKDAGALAYAVGRGAEDPNEVIVYVALSDIEKAKAMLGSEDMKKKMAEAGVEGEPTVYMFNQVESKSYAEKVAAAE
jgi:hypothetical protein